MLPRLLAAALLMVNFVFAAQADTTPKREPLYDIVGDFNEDGAPDRAVLILVGPGNNDTSNLEKERYGLGDDEQVDLAIYMGAGTTPLDITKPATFEKANIADQSRNLNWVVPLEVNKAGAIKMLTSEGWGSSHEEDETLTIQVGKGGPSVIGYDFVWELPGALSASCSIDLQKGSAIRDDGDHKKKFRVKAMPIALKDWKQPLWPKICSP